MSNLAAIINSGKKRALQR